jgi:hypothetical protein
VPLSLRRVQRPEYLHCAQGDEISEMGSLVLGSSGLPDPDVPAVLWLCHLKHCRLIIQHARRALRRESRTVESTRDKIASTHEHSRRGWRFKTLYRNFRQYIIRNRRTPCKSPASQVRSPDRSAVKKSTPHATVRPHYRRSASSHPARTADDKDLRSRATDEHFHTQNTLFLKNRYQFFKRRPRGQSKF